MPFRWSEAWGQWVPEAAPDESLPELTPLPLFGGPLEPERPHRCDDIRCVTCWNAGQRYAEYQKVRAMEFGRG